MTHPCDDRNFRLPALPRPTRYEARLALDLEGRRFEGHGLVELRLAEGAGEIVLHAASEVRVLEAELHAGDATIPVREIAAHAVSDTVRLVLASPAPGGAGELRLRWEGELCKGLRGLYRAGDVAVTQFEAADARRVFPCFDEPGMKASWALTLEAPAGLALLSNGKPLGAEEKDGRQVVTFAETPPLPTYLVALACGKLVSTAEMVVRGVPVRTWSVPEKAHLAAFGQEVAVEALPRLEDYFGLPYAFGKLDQVGVPEFEAGAMENAGLITFREAALLLDPNKASVAVLKRVAEVVTHELAHQWFGNWVTMQWWDDLWLNEAFATWMASKIVDGWRPGWRVWLDFDQGKAAALALDALRSTHPVRAEVQNPDDMAESFDLITYEKGGAVLRMIEGFLGEGAFRDGIRLYMRRHGQANAVADDLWGALAEASKQPVLELANAWIRQPGHPLLSVRREGATVHLAQRRFFSERGAEAGSAERWPIPVVLRYEDDEGVKEARHLLRGATDAVALTARGGVRWVCANAGSSGFYRVGYDDAARADLARHLARLAPAERVGLLADEWALVRAGARPVEAFLDLVLAYRDEDDHAVLDELVGRLAGVEARLEGATRDRFGGFVAGLLGPALAKVGWDAAPGEGDRERLRRAALVRAVGVVGRDPATMAEAARRLDRFLGGEATALEPNLHDAAVVMASRAGDAKRFAALRARFPGEPDPAFKRRYLVGLALFEDPALAREAQGLALSDEIPLQDLAFYAAGLLANRTARDAFWERLRTRWADVQARAGNAPMIVRRIVESIGQLPGRRLLDEVAGFFATQPVPAARQAVAQTLERMRQDVALWEEAAPAVARWLSAR